MEAIAHWISHYGYFAIFSLLIFGIVGLPVPDEWLLTFAGFLVYKHTLQPVPTVISGILGSSCGITVSYILGRTLGICVLKRYGRFFHITQERLDLVHYWFGRVGTWGLLVGYYIPGVRHLTAVVAGTSNLRPAVFGAFAYTGACIWVGTFVSVGYYFGDQWSQVLGRIQDHVVESVGIAAVVAVIYLLFSYWRKRRKATNA